MSELQVSGHFIDGDWRAPAGDGVALITDPATEEVVATFPVAGPDDVDVAVAAAARAAGADGGWARAAPAVRAAALRRFVEALAARRDELVEIAILETGSLAGLAAGLQTDFPLAMALRYAELAATYPFTQSVKLYGDAFGAVAGAPQVHRVEQAPAGVVSAITPFNYPVLVAHNKVFPALAAGCTVVLKPTPTTCWHAKVLAEAAIEAELPKGVLNVLFGGGAEAGERMVTNPQVDMITFTGSTATGRRIMGLAAGEVKKVLLELGGKSPNIVFADADLDAWLATDPAVLRHCGQGCGQLTRILVQRAVYDDVVDRLAARVASVKVGPPRDPSSEQGPLVSALQLERVLSYIEIGQAEGAKLVAGGGRPRHLDRGYYVEATLFADVDNGMRIAQEEIFGPVNVVIPFEDEDDAVRIANDSIYGINGSVWTSDRARAQRVASRVRTGTFGINATGDVTKGPHGGFKQTGIGREYWEWGIAEYLEPRAFTYGV